MLRIILVSGIATKLIQESLIDVKNYLKDNKSILKSILISTRSDNHAQSLYKKVLGAQVITTIKDLYSADEVLMLQRVYNEKRALHLPVESAPYYFNNKSDYQNNQTYKIVAMYCFSFIK